MTAPEEVVERLALAPRVWIRLAAALIDGNWTQVLLDLTIGAPPPGFRPLRWHYNSALLVSETRTGAVVARRLSSGRWQTGDLRVAIPAVAQGELRSDRRASNESDYWGEPLAWPTISTSLVTLGNLNVPNEPLVSPSAPSFLSWATGVAHLLNVDEPRTGGFSTQTTRLREQDVRARIEKVRLHSGEVEVFVEGEGLRGLTCELAGQAPGPSQKLTRRGTKRVRFRLDRQLPPESWIVLHDGHTWVDRRFLNHQWVRSENDVEVVLEPRNRLDALVGGHEGPDVEFKRELPKDSDAEKRTLLKTVGAFANGDGGTIAFGITDEEVVVGLPAASLRKSIDRLVDLVERWVEPHPEVSFETLALDGTSDVVLLMIVGSGRVTPYCVGRPSDERRVYVRRHGHTRPANQRELRSMVERTLPRDQGSGYGGFGLR